MDALKPNKLSHVGLSVPGIVFKYGKISGCFSTFYHVFGDAIFVNTNSNINEK